MIEGKKMEPQKIFFVKYSGLIDGVFPCLKSLDSGFPFLCMACMMGIGATRCRKANGILTM